MDMKPATEDTNILIKGSGPGRVIAVLALSAVVTGLLGWQFAQMFQGEPEYATQVLPFAVPILIVTVVGPLLALVHPTLELRADGVVITGLFRRAERPWDSVTRARFSLTKRKNETTPLRRKCPVDRVLSAQIVSR